MSEERGRPDANHCFVCGPDNPHGLRIRFWLEDDQCRAAFTPGAAYGGYDSMVHGGIIFSALDDVMANWLFLQGTRGHTAKCEIRYRQPVSIGTRLELTGRLIRRKGQVAVMAGEARRATDDVLVADAQGSFMVVESGE
ncbi:MAG: PaaI family thioesterase [Gammaproteobacteria bacterium]|nr:thioesterase [Chromatiales bacterium]MCP4924443.1 PaaI family thioesterase [Gammaproteobacteria bacterium]MDP7153724.1 PaaI family thioesterase [Gammaproteobacteria bacterium]MDP7296743.1 PaaI family thioesterase [Gammaproteobacteria bacterium]MDP7419201.1 PaaI family thioesterase [Gammaproteobacteria bacterium]